MDALSNLISILVPLSIASERLVEIVKQLVPFLNQSSSIPRIEARRTLSLHVIAVFAGIVTTLLARQTLGDAIPMSFQSPAGLVGLGLLASGGSGFWNSLSTYVLQAKNVKEMDAGARAVAVPSRAELLRGLSR
jgi:hypothetical protein